MKKSTLIILIVAGSLTLLGALILGIGMKFVFSDFRSSDPELSKMTYDVEETFDNISVNIHTAEISVIATDEQKVTVTTVGETEKLKYSVQVKDGTLCIDVIDTRAWYDHINIFSAERRISIYLPKGEYSTLTVKTNTGDVSVHDDLSFESADVKSNTGDILWATDTKGELKFKTDTGDIKIENSHCKSFEVLTETGDMEINNLSCNAISITSDTGKVKLVGTRCEGNIRIQTDTGDITLESTVSVGNMDITASTGDVRFNGCDADEIYVTTSTGDVMGNLLSDKIFICESSTGDIRVPSTESGGKCKIKTSTGDISITISK